MEGVTWEAWPFFDTPEERQEAAMRAGIGRVPLEVRALVFERDGNRCVRCHRDRHGARPGKEPGNKLLLTLDHITPRRDGGSNEPDNLCVLCWHCHHLRNRGEWDYSS